ncbi:hypothetical protein [Variovorax sp. HJSM1_2]|uniref:hypothetical protein n=1 Tax=Variovorax sp. HJSM1_2 TaxID=3366263 RepID=UPI003BBF64E2
MKTQKLYSIWAVAFAAIFSSAAFAADDGGLPKPSPDTAPAKSRVEVKSERAKAAKAGELSKNSNAYPVASKAEPASKKTRSEVKAETAAEKKANGGSLKTPRE